MRLSVRHRWADCSPTRHALSTHWRTNLSSPSSSPGALAALPRPHHTPEPFTDAGSMHMCGGSLELVDAHAHAGSMHMHRCGGSLELVDASSLCPALPRAEGLTSWVVLDDDVTPHPTYQSLLASTSMPKSIKRRFMPSMWPPEEKHARKKLKLRRCLRILPHLANMGGFFVALLRKTAPLPGPPPRATRPEATPSTVSLCGRRSTKKGIGGGEGGKDRFVPLPDAAVSDLGSQLGLRLAPLHALTATGQLLCRTAATGDDGCRAAVVSRVAPELSTICDPQRSQVDTAARNDGANGGAGDGGTDKKDDPTADAEAGMSRPPRPLRVVAAGCTLARRSRSGVYAPTAEGARVFTPLSDGSRQLVLGCEDGRTLLAKPTTTPVRPRIATVPVAHAHGPFSYAHLSNQLDPRPHACARCHSHRHAHGSPLSYPAYAQVRLDELSPTGAAAVQRVPYGPLVLLLEPADSSKPRLAVPARRVRKPVEGLRVHLLHTAGLEFRPKAIMHSMRSHIE